MKAAQQFIRIIHSFEEAEALEEGFCQSLSPAECISEKQVCRDLFFKMKYGDKSAHRKRLRRVIRISHIL